MEWLIGFCLGVTCFCVTYLLTMVVLHWWYRND